MPRIRCPKCQSVATIEEALSGTVVACAQCGTKLRAPAAAGRLATGVKPDEAITSRPARRAASVPATAELDELDIVDDDEGQDDTIRPGRKSATGFDPVPYVPDGGVAAYGIPLLLVTVGLASTILAVSAALIGQWLYPIVLMPIGIGFGLYGAGYLAIRLGKVRSRLVGALAGLFGGLLTILLLHYSFYVHALIEAPTLGPAERIALAMSPGAFVHFIDAQAQDGVRIMSNNGLPKNQESNLGYVGSYIYWGGELLMVAGIALAGMMLAAARPYCGRCQRWKQPHILGALAAPGPSVVAVLKEGRVDALAECQPAPGAPCVLTAAVCPVCSKGDIDVKLEHVIGAGNSKRKRCLVHVTYPRGALPALQAALSC
jgi:hypothetical protein